MNDQMAFIPIKFQVDAFEQFTSRYNVADEASYANLSINLNHKITYIKSSIM